MGRFRIAMSDDFCSCKKIFSNSRSSSVKSVPILPPDGTYDANESPERGAAPSRLAKRDADGNGGVGSVARRKLLECWSTVALLSLVFAAGRSRVGVIDLSLGR